MRDDQELMIKLVKIIERHPDLYDTSLDGNSMRYCIGIAWEKVADCVRKELKEPCTAEELKIKWKGIRSSYSRYKNKLNQNGPKPVRKYYLSDYLKFLDPFTKTTKNLKGTSESTSQNDESYYDADEKESSNDYFQESEGIDIKVEHDEDTRIYTDLQKPFVKEIENDSSDSSKESYRCKPAKRRKHNDKDGKTNTEDCEYLQFFRSIIPDIQSFSRKERRKFKMGVLQLIDNIEEERKKE